MSSSSSTLSDVKHFLNHNMISVWFDQDSGALLPGHTEDAMLAKIKLLAYDQTANWFEPMSNMDPFRDAGILSRFMRAGHLKIVRFLFQLSINDDHLIIGDLRSGSGGAEAAAEINEVLLAAIMSGNEDLIEYLCGLHIDGDCLEISDFLPGRAAAAEILQFCAQSNMVRTLHALIALDERRASDAAAAVSPQQQRRLSLDFLRDPGTRLLEHACKADSGPQFLKALFELDFPCCVEEDPSAAAAAAESSSLKGGGDPQRRQHFTIDDIRLCCGGSSDDIDDTYSLPIAASVSKYLATGDLSNFEYLFSLRIDGDHLTREEDWEPVAKHLLNSSSSGGGGDELLVAKKAEEECEKILDRVLAPPPLQLFSRSCWPVSLITADAAASDKKGVTIVGYNHDVKTEAATTASSSSSLVLSADPRQGPASFAIDIPAGAKKLLITVEFKLDQQ